MNINAHIPSLNKFQNPSHEKIGILCTKPTPDFSLYLRIFGWETLQHPPYSPDLAPSDYHVFGPMKKALSGRRFRCDEEVQREVRRWFRTQDTNFFETGILKLVKRWDKCINVHGSYVEK